MTFSDTKLGVAVIGLGAYGAGQIIPALQQTELCRLRGLVSGSKEKTKKYAKEYNIEPGRCYSYENFDQVVNDPAIDIVYIALPNSLHAEFTVRAARAGKHIICEKPMAMNVAECHQMINAVELAGVRFSMGYRLHFDPFNQEMMRLGQHEQYGMVDRMELQNSMQIKKGEWRLKKALAGGGPLMNNGIYCVQAAVYLTGKLPLAVEAHFAPITNKQKFNEVEEGIVWTMYFGDGVVAHCETSYSRDQNLMRAETETGWFELSPAYEYSGLKGRTKDGPMKFAPVSQQARQLDDFARCILENQESRVPAEMGLRDMEIIEAIYESATIGKRIELELSDFASLLEP